MQCLPGQQPARGRSATHPCTGRPSPGRLSEHQCLKFCLTVLRRCRTKPVSWLGTAGKTCRLSIYPLSMFPFLRLFSCAVFLVPTRGLLSICLRLAEELCTMQPLAAGRTIRRCRRHAPWHEMREAREELHKELMIKDNPASS